MSVEYSPRFPSMDEVARLTAEANAMRARMVAELAGKAIAGIKSFLGGLVGGTPKDRVMAELQAMDDRLLHDIGITRGDIIAVANGLKTERDVANENRAALAARALPAA